MFHFSCVQIQWVCTTQSELSQIYSGLAPFKFQFSSAPFPRPCTIGYGLDGLSILVQELASIFRYVSATEMTIRHRRELVKNLHEIVDERRVLVAIFRLAPLFLRLF